MNERKYGKQYEKRVLIKEDAIKVFTFADDHGNFSSHMSKSSWMMGGGKMCATVDEGGGQKVGSHIRMSGKTLGINLYLDEVVTQHNPPSRKVWETIGEINLLVIDHYKLGFEITPKGKDSELKVFIEYNLPKSWKTCWLGLLFGKAYAKWCVEQMAIGTQRHFEKL